MNYKKYIIILISLFIVITIFFLLNKYVNKKTPIQYGEIISKKYYDDGDLSGGFNLVNKAINTYPEESAFYYMRANIYYDEGKLNEALENYATAYYLSPNNVDFVKEYVKSLNLLGESEEAYSIIENFESKFLLKDYIDDSDFWLEKAVASINTNRCADAGASAYHVIMNTNEEEDIYKLARSILYKAGQLDDCLE